MWLISINYNVLQITTFYNRSKNRIFKALQSLFTDKMWFAAREQEPLQANESIHQRLLPQENSTGKRFINSHRLYLCKQNHKLLKTTPGQLWRPHDSKQRNYKSIVRIIYFFHENNQRQHFRCMLERSATLHKLLIANCNWNCYKWPISVIETETAQGNNFFRIYNQIYCCSPRTT